MKSIDQQRDSSKKLTANAQSRDLSPAQTTGKKLSPWGPILQAKWYSDYKAEFGDMKIYYDIEQEMSRGGYGVVYKGKMKKNEVVTDKVVAIKAFFQHIHLNLILSEVYFLKIVHKNDSFIQLLDFRVTNRQAFVVTEYFPHDVYEKFIYEDFPMIEIKFYMRSLLQSVSQFHGLGLIHRDIKPANFLYNKELKKGVLIDYGLAEIDPNRQLKKDIKNYDIYTKLKDIQNKLGHNKIGTEGYMPLEQVIKSEKQNNTVDVWACGAIFLGLLARKTTVFKSMKHIKREQDGHPSVEYILMFLYMLAQLYGKRALTQTLDELGTKISTGLTDLLDFNIQWPKDNLPEEPVSWDTLVKHPEKDAFAIDLLSQMLNLNWQERISAEEALNSPFFEEIEGL